MEDVAEVAARLPGSPAVLRQDPSTLEETLADVTRGRAPRPASPSRPRACAAECGGQAGGGRGPADAAASGRGCLALSGSTRPSLPATGGRRTISVRRAGRAPPGQAGEKLGRDAPQELAGLLWRSSS